MTSRCLSNRNCKPLCGTFERRLIRSGTISLSFAVAVMLCAPAQAQQNSWLDKKQLIKYPQSELPRQKVVAGDFGKPCGRDDIPGFALAWKTHSGSGLRRENDDITFEPVESSKYMFISDAGRWSAWRRRYNASAGFSDEMKKQYNVELSYPAVTCMKTKEGLKKFRAYLVNWWADHYDKIIGSSPERPRVVMDVDIDWPRGVPLE